MIKNEHALDTISGGLIVILICLICSLNLLLLQLAIEDAYEDPIEEDRFDYILGSEICVSSSLGIRMTVYDYILQMQAINQSEFTGIWENVSQIQEEMSNLIEFYHNSAKGWTLSVTVDGGWKVILESIEEQIHDYDTIIQKRVVGGKSVLIEISLTIFL